LTFMCPPWMIPANRGRPELDSTIATGTRHRYLI
jgi:hypothetical protein